MNDSCVYCGRRGEACDCPMLTGFEPAQCSACGAYGCLEGDECLGCGQGFEQGFVTIPAEDVVEGDRLPRGVGYPDEVLEVLLG